MARTSGTYTLPSNSVSPAVNGTPIDPTDFNTTMDDIETAINASTYTDGLGATANFLVRTATTDTKKLSVSGVSVGSSGNDVSHTGNTIEPWASLTCSNGVNNDKTLADGTNFYITGPTSTYSITGLTGGVDGRMIRLYNSVNFAMTISNDNAGSIGANRIGTLSGADLVTTTIGIVTLVYSTTANRWILVSSQT